MQVQPKLFNPDLHERFHALTVKNPYAHYIMIGLKVIEVRKKRTSFRGDLVITSSHSPEVNGMQSGVTLARVELYDCRPVSELTWEEWERTTLPRQDRHKYQDHFAWMLRDVRELVPIPVRGQLGIWSLCVGKYELNEFPTNLYNVLEREEAKREPERRLKKGYGVLILWFIVVALSVFFLFFFA